MKIQKRHFVLLLLLILTLSLLSCKSGQSNEENTVTEVTKTDDYELLRNPAKAPQRMSEDLSGRVIVLSETDFEERITQLNNPKGFQYKGQTPCIVLLHTFRCAPSTTQAEIMNDLAPEFKGKVIFYKIDLDRARGLVKDFKVKRTPVILYFKPHEAIKSTVGQLNPDELRNAIEKYLLNP